MSARLRVLIADDHPIFRRGLCDVIETDEGLQLAGQAGNGEEALRLVEELQPDIAIFDVHMPKLTGLQAARKLVERKSPVKLILLTMHEDEDLLNEARLLSAPRSPECSCVAVNRAQLSAARSRDLILSLQPSAASSGLLPRTRRRRR
jgi:DNA-binding NarL/FixJ family response regulator